jgi:hypothetical protein
MPLPLVREWAVRDFSVIQTMVASMAALRMGSVGMFFNSRLLFTLLALFCISGHAVRAQVARYATTPAQSRALETVVVGAEATKSATTAAVVGAAASEPTLTPFQQQRLAKIRAVKFDRRPSTILRVWAEDAQPTSEAANEAANEPADKTEAAAADANGTEAATPASEPASEPATEPATEPEEPADASTEPAAEVDAKPEQTPEQIAAAKLLADAAGKAKREAEELATLDEQLKRLQIDVTLSRWASVREFVTSLEESEGKVLYQHMLTSLSKTAAALPANASPQMIASIQNQRGVAEKNVYSFDDVLALVAAAPTELEEPWLLSVGKLVRLAFDSGNVIKSLVGRMQAECAKPADEALINQRQAAKILQAAGQPVDMGKFLPTVEVAVQTKDFEGLNLLTTHLLAIYAEEKELVHLEGAWGATQAVLAGEKLEDDEKKTALRRSVELAPQIRESLGKKWLEESFTARPERGLEIIATIGGAAATGLQNRATDPSYRLKGLELQSTAVEALLNTSPDLAAEWAPILRILAQNWLQEAKIADLHDTSTTRGPSMQRDAYGNLFYFNSNSRMSQANVRIRAIPVGQLLELRPGAKWLEMVIASARPEFDKVTAQLLLKVEEEDEAFPYIESLAKSHPEIAKDLVDQFLTVWTKNHDPNATRNRTNSYMYMYGFERKAEGIPLTRSKQQRNLKELSALVTRLNQLPVELDEHLLARAFTTCHSSAEVYQLAAIENVFGSVDNLEPKTLAELVQQMRANLIGVWRDPANQKDKGTRRKQKDIEAEVMRGYDVARAVVERAVDKHPADWALQLAMASLDHDQNNYQREIQPQSDFSVKRIASFDGFEKAAIMYVESSKDLRQDEETTKAFEIWFYAALGACDLNQVKPDMVADRKQAERIRSLLESLKGEAQNRHLDIFANTLFVRMSAVNPGVKPQYLSMGFEICGDREQAREARKVFDYYADLNSEIRLNVHLDGAAEVGTKPFGVFVDLEHTREIERESGGFRRYLQNQNSGRLNSYNYGRPTEDYLEKFEEATRRTLGDHFEVLSVTFQAEDVNSRSLSEYGWRVTPYAYVLLQSRGPEVDSLPPLRLDLDFLDTSGYVVLPIESPVVPIDASSKPTVRPVTNLSVTQTLDERQAKEGKLLLEVKASGHGLVPGLEELLQVNSKGFEITGVDDEGVSVSRFDPESDDNVVVSERLIVVTLEAHDPEDPPTNFSFAETKLPVKEVLYQRYNDSDLAAVERDVDLNEQYQEAKTYWPWIVAAVLTVICSVLLCILFYSTRPSATRQTSSLQMPDRLTPFTVLSFLRTIEQHNGFSAETHTELQGSISQIEGFYFGEEGVESTHVGAAPDLEQVAQTWLSRV